MKAPLPRRFYDILTKAVYGLILWLAAILVATFVDGKLYLFIKVLAFFISLNLLKITI